MPPYRPSMLEVRDHVREVLVGAGLTEVVTHALVAPADIERFPPLPGPVPPGEGEAGGEPIQVVNPLSRDHSVLRRSLLGSLLEVVTRNLRHGHDAVAVFEIGKGYGRERDEPREWTRLGVALQGPIAPPHWADPVRPADLDDLKGIVELLGGRPGRVVGGLTWEPLVDDPTFHPGRAAGVLAVDPGGAVLVSGRIGELHPALAAAFELGPERVLLGELAVAGLTGGRRAVAHAAAPPRHPAVERDIAVVVGADLPASRIASTIRERAGDLLADLRLFDVYRGAPLDPDEKSIAFRLVFQAAGRTLTEGEVDDAMADVGAGLADLGGRIRA
jgi:phenylalanyl-tRNA synthetase beta chain